MAVTMPVSARLAATERSMHLVRITVIWPSASMIRIEVSLKTLPRFRGRAKPGKRSEIRRISAAMAAASRISRDFRMRSSIRRPP